MAQLRVLRASAFAFALLRSNPELCHLDRSAKRVQALQRENKLTTYHQQTSTLTLVLRYAITDSLRYSDSFALRKAALITATARWSEHGIDYIQLREKDLQAGDLFTLAQAMVQTLGPDSPTRLLVNGRADVALATGAHGVHLTSHPGELTPTQVRSLFTMNGADQPIVSVSCHTTSEAQSAGTERADLILFGPVFSKHIHNLKISDGLGLGPLHEASLAAPGIPVLALGGVTHETRDACLTAGAAGLAGIRLFD